jgi:hypothetical protein
MIRRMHPPKTPPQSPLSVFSVLLIGQGFGSQAEFQGLVKQQFWPRLIATAPFEKLDHPTTKNRMNLYYDPCQEVNLNLVQSGNVLSIPTASKDVLTNFLQTHTVQSNGSQPVQANIVWPRSLRTGRNGGLIAAVLKGNATGELYQLNPSDAYPTPLVGAVAAGNDWMMTIIRAIGSLYAGLVDEYSLPDHLVLGEPFSRDKFPLDYFAPFPNLAILNDEQRARLAGGEKWHDVLGCLPPAFQANSKRTLTFIPTYDISSISRSSNIVTVTTTTTHTFSVGQKVIISAVTTDASFNGTYAIATVPSGTTFTYNQTAADSSDTGGTAQSEGPSGGAVNLFESGATFRHNVARGFKDCIMRRQPLATGADTIQTPVDFCGVCRNAIEGAMRGDPDFDLVRAKRITIDSQKTVYDMINWGDAIKTSKGALAATLLAATNVKPRWSFTVQADASVGVRVTELKLLDRDGDPFKAAENIMQEIDWGPLSVLWDGDSNPTQLAWSDAFSNAQHPPQVELAGPDPGGKYQLGFKVCLTWEFANKRPVEVKITFVTCAPKNDFDPGGAVLACKFYPQMAMRILDPSAPPQDWCAKSTPFKREGKKRPKATSLQGAIVCVCNNVIPQTIQAPGLEEFSTGTLKGSFFTDSNSTLFDNDYLMTENFAAEIGAKHNGADIPYFGLWNGSWRTGRLMASVGDGLTNVLQIGGSTALFGYKQRAGPLLPHWSWLFDYASPALTQRKEITAATYAEGAGETTLDGSNPGAVERIKEIPYPDSKYVMTILKKGRQGQYDNIHVHAALPLMNGKELVAAPFCGDMCFHLHWRWGLDAVSSIAAPYAFLGWGPTGEGIFGAHSTLGAPLIPPNQHLRVVGDPASDNSTLTITYDVTALGPAINAWQVFLEQGMGIAFRYAIAGLTEFCSPLNTDSFPALLAALGVLQQGLTGNAVADERKRLLDLKSSSKLVELDAAIRLRFHDIYSRIRYYDKANDGFEDEQIPTYNEVLEKF